MAGANTTTTLNPNGSITAKTGQMITQADEMINTAKTSLSEMSTKINAVLDQCSGWEGADKEAFKNLIIRFQTYFDDIARTLEKYGDQVKELATVYARAQQSNIDYYNNISYTSVFNDTGTTKP